MAARPKKQNQNYQLPPELFHELPEGEEEISDPNELEALGVEPDDDALMAALEGQEDQPIPFVGTGHTSTAQPWRKKLDFFSKLAPYPEIMMELATQLRSKSFISLYSISKDFHEIVDGHLLHVLKLCAERSAPESSKIFVYTLYRPLCVPDPVGRIIPEAPDEVRMVPSLRWLQMVYHRERVVRDILALLAREGHRCPKGMSMSLKKLWLTMDISTSKRRSQLFHNSNFWTDVDLYNIQFFCVKLEMRFNDPVDGPGDDGLRRLLLGQRGLSPLWRALRREGLKTPLELAQMAIRYCYVRPREHRDQPIFGIPWEEVGMGHLEGWGKGRIHLYRPDELVMRESVRRNLKLKDHLMSMMLWGYVDPVTMANIKVSEEEMYMSDDDIEDGGKEWSNREKTRWTEPSWDKLHKREEEEKADLAREKAEAMERGEDSDAWSSTDDGAGDGFDGMDVDHYGGADLEEDFLDSMDVDSDGELIDP